MELSKISTRVLTPTVVALPVPDPVAVLTLSLIQVAVSPVEAPPEPVAVLILVLYSPRTFKSKMPFTGSSNLNGMVIWLTAVPEPTPEPVAVCSFVT